MRKLQVCILCFALVALAGCAGGPGMRLMLTFHEGPDFRLDFSVTPFTNAPVALQLP